MKKLMTAVMLVSAIAIAPSAKAVLFVPEAVLFVAGVAAGTQWGKPVPFHLTDACKAQVVQVKDSNYSYTSYEHCLKK